MARLATISVTKDSSKAEEGGGGGDLACGVFGPDQYVTYAK